MARARALAAALAVSLLAVAGAGGSGAQAPRVGGTLVFGTQGAGGGLREPPCLNILLERTCITTGNLTPIISQKVVHEQVRSVRAVDAKTVSVVLRSRFAGWRGLFGTVLPSHALSGQDPARIWTDGIDNPKTGAPIGSGPFLVERWERGRQIVLRRNPNYWGRRPRLDRIVIRYRMSSLNPVEWLRSGEVDVAQHVTLLGIPELRKEPGVTIVPGPTSQWEHLTLNRGPGGHPALKKKAIRQALAYGLDRAALIRNSPLAGADPTLRPLNSVVFLPQSPHYRPNWSRYDHDPRLARQLLERSGCRRGSDGIYLCDGQRLRLRLAARQGLVTPTRVVELVRDQLREIGVEIVLEFAPPLVVTRQIITRGDFDLVQFAWFNPGADPSVAHGIFGCGVEQSFGGYCQRLVTRELDQAKRILDADEQARVLNRADLRVASDVPVIPLYQQTQSVALRSTVRNFGLSLNTQLAPLWNVEKWWLADPR